MPVKLQRTTWRSYLEFRSLCCVETLPFHAGPCFRYADHSAFIGYNFPFRHSRLRYRVFSDFRFLTPRAQTDFLSRYVWSLSRVMVKPAHRGQGIGLRIVQESLPFLKKPFVECNTFTPAICTILAKAGFQCFGWDKQNSIYYYLYSTHLNPNDAVKNYLLGRPLKSRV
jgi:GNAT superfamily N-acetyltransferase